MSTTQIEALQGAVREAEALHSWACSSSKAPAHVQDRILRLLDLLETVRQS